MTETFFLRRGGRIIGPLVDRQILALDATENWQPGDAIGGTDTGPWQPPARLVAALQEKAAEQPQRPAAQRPRQRPPAAPDRRPAADDAAESPRRTARRAAGRDAGRAAAQTTAQTTAQTARRQAARKAAPAAAGTSRRSGRAATANAATAEAARPSLPPVPQLASDAPVVRGPSLAAPPIVKAKKPKKQPRPNLEPSPDPVPYRLVGEDIDRGERKTGGVGSVLVGLWEAIPPLVKGLAVILVLGVFLVVMPLLSFKRQAYLDEGGRFGHNSADTFFIMRYKGTDQDDAATAHLARRTLRQQLVKTDLAIDQMRSRRLLDAERCELLRQMLDNSADHWSLRKRIDCADMTGLSGMVIGCGLHLVLFENLQRQMDELIANDQPADIEAFEQFLRGLESL